MKSTLLTFAISLQFLIGFSQQLVEKTMFSEQYYSSVSDNILMLSDSTFLLSGTMDYNIFVAKLDKHYNAIWSKVIEGEVTTNNDEYRHNNNLRILSDTTFQLISSDFVSFGLGATSLFTMDTSGTLLSYENLLFDDFKFAKFPQNGHNRFDYIVQSETASLIVTLDSLGNHIYDTYQSDNRIHFIDNIVSINDSADLYLGYSEKFNPYSKKALMFLKEGDSIVWANLYNSSGLSEVKDVLVSDSTINVLSGGNSLLHSSLDITTGKLSSTISLDYESAGIISNENIQYIKQIDSVIYIQANNSLYRVTDEDVMRIYNYISITDLQFYNDTSFHYIGKLLNFPVNKQWYNATDIGVAAFANIETAFTGSFISCIDVFKDGSFNDEISREAIVINQFTDTLVTDFLDLAVVDFELYTREGCVSAPSSIAEQSISNINLYPNPTSRSITIDSDNRNIESIEIYNEMGQQVSLPSFLYGNSAEIDCSNQSPGFYFVKIQTNYESVVKKMLLVK